MSNNYYTTCPQYFYQPIWYQGTNPYIPNYDTGFPSTQYSYYSSPHVSNSPDNLLHQVPASSIPQHQVTHQPLRCLWNTDGQQCQEVFSNSEDLGFHVREEHAEGRQICQWDNCGKEFKQKYRLVNHLPVHTREKAFQCDTCAKLFARAENLKIHKRTHTGEKPFACTHSGCDKRFGSSTDRKKHMYCHAEKKKYICEDHEKLDTGKLASANGTPPPVLKKQDMSMREFIKWSDGYLRVLQNPYINSRHQFDWKAEVEDEELKID
ncbi:hypothetical protein GCK72_007540 [Caenorhabditis remanei]|uniref:C2H2-type domain-containing protein n=1 Tax=Caenorhabditis remanei TaxID=31234 RepID=A0A6A5HKD0_CAERE|nr:hypothetical protein GCK72_007540 [Caenorhabditis remanei]KAF1767581.1 hypothetical protein GCK72_007540 [Caenorhabditis remanei]